MNIHSSFQSSLFHIQAVHLMMAALSSALMAADPPPPRSLPDLMPAPEFVLEYQTEIGLTAAQRSQLESALSEQRSAAWESEAQVQVDSNALTQLLTAEKPDDIRVAAQFEKLLASENEIKRVRLKLSLRTLAVLTKEQRSQIEVLQKTTPKPRAGRTEEQELASKMSRVKGLINRAKLQGRDLGKVREMWKLVDRAAQDGNFAEASRILDETMASLETTTPAAPSKR